MITFSGLRVSIFRVTPHLSDKPLATMETPPLQVNRPNSPRQRAFTLVEVLIVMAIISALAALAFPVFAYGVRAARRSACMSNMRQLTLNMHLYLHDYDNVFPSYRVDPQNIAHADDLAFWHDRFCQGRDANAPSWTTLLSPYPKPSKTEDSPLFCPFDRRLEPTKTTSYEFKMWLALGRNEYEIPTPSGMALFWEQWSFHSANPTSEYDRRSNLFIAFLDGHAKPIALENTTTARYSSGPDLHWFFNSVGTESQGLSGRDIMD